MENDQLKIILERMEKLQGVLNRIDKDLSTDREDIQNFSLRLGSLENQQAEIWKILNNLPGRTKQDVKEAVQLVANETHDLKEVIANKKFIAIDIAKAKRSFWKWIFRKN